MKVARSIYDSDGRILLNSGVKLTSSYIKRLKELEISSVYIKDERFGEIDIIKDVVSETTRIQTSKIVKSTFSNLEKQRKINVRQVQSTVKILIDELLCNSDVLINLTDIRTFDDYTFGHSVNVCILSIMTGITMGYNDSKLTDLGTGALLHDIGKTHIDKNILNKPGKLSNTEYNEIKKHTEQGFEILRSYEDISLLSAHIAFQHHERWDGKGYPRRLKGENILEYARIVAAADVYDALIADRPYRSSYTITEALSILKNMTGEFLDPRCSTALLANIATYPIGSIVELNTGSIGIVVDVNKNYPTRPVVRIVYDRSFKKAFKVHEIDLSKMSTILVKAVLTEEELNSLFN